MLAMANRQYRSVSPSRLAVEEGAKRARREHREQRERTRQYTIQTHNKKCSFSILCLSSAFPPVPPFPPTFWVQPYPGQRFNGFQNAHLQHPSLVAYVGRNVCNGHRRHSFTPVLKRERERGRRERERETEPRDRTERQNRETEPRDRTERQNRETEPRDRTEREQREISALYSALYSVKISPREAYPTSSDRSAGTNFSIAPRRSISWA
jgi:hypothetical protein